MTTTPAATQPPDPILERLEDQIGWYDRKSVANQRIYKQIKVIEIIAAAIIPFLAGFQFFKTWAWVTGILGVLVTVLEGLLHLNQYQQNWTSYRSTCEALRHEKFLYIAKAGPYAGASDPRAMLAERVESIASQENSKWSVLQQPEKKDKA
ncbi:MAG TPA: DUF4231 domain-containing protein [Candidatus Angelobacter sp.]